VGTGNQKTPPKRENIVKKGRPCRQGRPFAHFLVTGGKKTVKKRTEFIDLTLEIVKESGYNTDL
jgi:hypothetical protein